MREILVGRDAEDAKRFGMKATAFLAKHYVKTGDEINLSGQIFMDLARPHIILVCGKRGQGKSYTLGTIAEEISMLPDEERKKVAVVIFDTMGIYWTMKYPNYKEAHLLEPWGLKPKKIDINMIVPYGFAEQFKQAGIPVDTPFALKPSELSAAELCMTFEIPQYGEVGVALARSMKALENQDFSIDELITTVKNDENATKEVKNSLENRLLAAKDWGLFHEKGTSLEDVIRPGKINVLDVSVYGSAVGAWSVRALVMGLLVKRTFRARTIGRKLDELKQVQSYRKGEFSYGETQEGPLEKKERLSKSAMEAKIPIVWFLIDEAHEVLPREGTTPALEPLLQLIREGRQPGLTLVAATQQPGKIHTDIMTQCDMVLAHRVTSVPDITALNQIMSNYMVYTLEKYMASLPRFKGAAILLDDNSEKIYAVRTRPRLSWHGGESATMLTDDLLKKEAREREKDLRK